MSLAADVTAMEEELYDLRLEARDLEKQLAEARDEVDGLEEELAKADEFIEYVDKTHPELRIAYEASLVLNPDT